MKHSRVKALGLTLGMSLLAGTMSPGALAAQSQLDVAQAQAFLGKWVISMQTDMGPFSMNLELVDQGGKVAANIGAPEMGGMQSVTDVTRSGESLVLRFEANAQGQFFDVLVALAPNGQNLSVLFEVGTGEFSASGVATRATS